MNEQGKKKGKGCLIAVLIAVVVLFVGCGAIGSLLFSLGTSSSKSSGSKSSSSKDDERDAELAEAINSGELDDAMDSYDTSEEEEKDSSEEAYNGSGVPDELTDEILAKYLEEIQPADDEYDYLYSSDYEYVDMLDIERCNDPKAYEKVFGYHDVTLEQIKAALNKNDKVSPKYKEYIYDFAVRLRELYPNANLSVLHYNLQTVEVREMTEEEMAIELMSLGSAAFYQKLENYVAVPVGMDPYADTDSYIIFTHELCHLARSIHYQYDPDVRNIEAGFYINDLMGLYAEEGIVTNIAYEMHGLGEKALYYPMQSTYFRIICDCVGFTGEDFFNHNVGYLMKLMDDFMGDEQYAYQIIARIDAQAHLRYSPHRNVDFHDFQPVYEYVAEMYFRKYIEPGMSREQAEEVFDLFYEEITFNFENMNRKYTIDENTFMPTFEAYLQEVGIQ